VRAREKVRFRNGGICEFLERLHVQPGLRQPTFGDDRARAGQHFLTPPFRATARRERCARPGFGRHLTAAARGRKEAARSGQTRRSSRPVVALVINFTASEMAWSDSCQLRFWAITQPAGWLASGNCSHGLCVEVTERYSSGQLLVGNLAKSTQPQVAFSTRRKREPLQEQRP
jgi:hypothetical protein